jgi:hypothetical protein
VETTRDEEIRQVIQPFLAWRSLVIANPIWYPSLSHEIRMTIFTFIQNILNTSIFNPEDVNQYLKK